MADLLLHWLNHELELSTHVTRVETDFASGYLLGEILHRLNHQHDFAAFMRSSSADAKILNFCLLEPTLRNLNIKFDANAAAAIMNEKKDAAANLLYQIKIAAARVGRAPAVSTKSLERSAILPLHNRPVKLGKPSYDVENHRVFEHSIRRHARSIASLQQEKDQLAEEMRKREAYQTRMAEQKEVLEATKAERLHRAYIHSTFIKEALEETDSPAWRLALQKKSAREKRRAAFLQQLMRKRQEAEEDLTFSLRRKVEKDLDEFDGEGGLKATRAGGKLSSRKSVGYGLRSLTTALHAATDKTKYATANLAGSPMNERELYHANTLGMESASGAIKQQRLEREKRKEQLSRRRKRFVQECVFTHSRVGAARVASLLEDVVLRETNSERAVQGEMGRVLAYKEVARANRSMRNQEYVNQQELDATLAVDRDTSCYHNLLLRFEEDSEMQAIQRRNVQASVEAADRFLSGQIAAAVMEEMVAFVLFIAREREESVHSGDPAVFLAPEPWKEYKVQFSNGCKLEHTSPFPAPDALGQGELLDAHQLEHYLSVFRPFHAVPGQQHTAADASLFVGAMEAIEECFVLGEQVKSLRWIARSALPSSGSLAEAELAMEPNSDHGSGGMLRVLIFGPPFAGKETQAKLLGETHNLAVLSVHELVQRAIDNSSDIGQEVETRLATGQEVSPELYSRLVMKTIREFEAQADAEGSADKSGWVIYDLPATERHAHCLEEQLTGYVDPALIPSPYDFESPIAPGCSKPTLPSTFLHGKSGVDLVFHIDCPLGTVLDRCLGKVEASATGEKHHLVFDPPPDDSTVRHRLQHVNPSVYSSELLSLHCLANDGFSLKHKAWHAKFKTLHEPSSTGMTVAEVHEAIAAVVSRFQRDKQEEGESKRLQQEASEHELMATEEERHRRILGFEMELDEAKHGVTTMEAAVAEAEEAKAKKEEIVELRQKLEEAQRQVDDVLSSAQSWVREEQSRRPVPKSKFSGELVPATAHALAAMWNDMEVEYLATMKTSFSLLREQRRRVTERVQLMTSDFCEFVRRPDHKQEIVNVFQKQFNEVVDEMRFDAATKVELHARADMLQEELGALVEAKVAENDEELSGMVGDGWTEDTCQRVAAVYQIALQAECDRFRVSVQLLVDGYYAASTDRSQLTGIVEAWQAHQSRLELACRLFRDPTSEPPQEVQATPAAAVKAASKGKAKASVPAALPPASAAAPGEDSVAESLLMSELLAEFSQVVQRCGSWVEAIAPFAATVTENAAGGGTDGASQHLEAGSGDLCKRNLLSGIRYEHDLMQRRVRYLQEATETSCDDITRSMRSVEITLRGVLEDRRDREQVAIAALIEHVRGAIEAEAALPCFIDTSPEIIQRYPTTVQLREDTMVRVDASRRLLPRAAPDTPPVVEEAHALLLNPRQREHLREALAAQSFADSGLLPLCTVVETMTALTSQPDALPEVWRRCPAHVIAEIAAGFVTNHSAFVDMDGLLAAMSSRDDLLLRFQEDEAREHLERQRQLELQRLQQEQELVQQQEQAQQQDTQDGKLTGDGSQ